MLHRPRATSFYSFRAERAGDWEVVERDKRAIANVLAAAESKSPGDRQTENNTEGEQTG
jgi:hypothetical protein